ncbi:segregation and condensation protein B [Kribbella orskensis]|uniref:Segregation and condensation protein B n=1 Tax=Kribbella orskensis TaxID=2512216 RepID=A0ABY2BH08_9ACTN|nr:segregation and condensation protein B [Kribbella sp. VKM Ac-2500]TCO20049.1 segregation and condensation protein B [Kribbella orskensis]
MTKNQTPTDLQDNQQSPADPTTADALDSVTTTEHPVDQSPAGDAEPSADDQPASEGSADAEQPASEAAGDAPSGDEVAGDEGAPGQAELPVGDEVVIDDDTMRRALEAILMVTDEPLPVLTLARSVGRPTPDVSAALTGLSEEYTEQGRGFDLREVGGGWRYYTREDAAQYVERFVLDGQQARLTQAALETLAVVAYKQPVSRARVSAIRGVNVDGVMRTLISRGLVEEAGADTESQAILYRTTSYFLERMGMQSLDDLPELAPYLPEMDDMEEELAAQAAADAAPPASSDGADEPPAQQPLVPEPASDAATAADARPADDADTADDAAAADAGPVVDVPGAEADATPDDGEAVTSDIGAVAADPEVLLTTEDMAGDESDQADEESDPGIDGDLSTDEPSDLDLEHTPEHLDPADEVESGGDSESAEESEPVEEELEPEEEAESAEEELAPAEELEAVGEVDEDVDLAEIPEVGEDGAFGVAADDGGTGTASERVERSDG